MFRKLVEGEWRIASAFLVTALRAGDFPQQGPNQSHLYTTMFQNALPLLSLALLAVASESLEAQQAVRFGRACRFQTQTVLIMNQGANVSPTSVTPPGDAWIYVQLDVPNGAPMVINGFEMLLQSVTGAPVRINAGIFTSDANGRPSALLVNSSTIYVDGTQRWCATWCPARTLSAGGTYFLGFRSPSSVVAMGRTGSTTPTPVNWYAQRDNLPMSTRVASALKYRVVSGGATPNISAVTLPQIGSRFVFRVDNVPTGFPVIGGPPVGFPAAYAGFSNSAANLFGAWRALPWDMTAIGSPQCDVSVSPDIFLPYYQGPTADSRESYIDLPNLPALQGLQFFTQWALWSGGQGQFFTSGALQATIG